MRTGVVPVLAFEFLFGVGEAAAPVARPADPRAEIEGLILSHAERARLSPRFLRAVIAAESEFRPGAVSPRGARGLMQVMPATAEEFGVAAGSLGEPGPNIQVGTTYLLYLYGAARSRYGLKAERLVDAPPWVQHRVLAAYNGGPRLLFQERWPGETRRYVAKVTRLAGLKAPQAAPPRPPPSAPTRAPTPAPTRAPEPPPADAGQAWLLEI